MFLKKFRYSNSLLESTSFDFTSVLDVLKDIEIFEFPFGKAPALVGRDSIIGYETPPPKKKKHFIMIKVILSQEKQIKYFPDFWSDKLSHPTLYKCTTTGFFKRNTTFLNPSSFSRWPWVTDPDPGSCEFCPPCKITCTTGDKLVTGSQLVMVTS